MEHLDQFLELIRQFVEQEIPAKTFEEKYLALFRSTRDSGGLDQIDRVMDGAASKLFAAVDCFNEQFLPRNKYELDAEQLRRKALVAYKALTPIR